jgi:antitoxin component YwqK of YwqJK toxin-antitoxin module
MKFLIYILTPILLGCSNSNSNNDKTSNLERLNDNKENESIDSNTISSRYTNDTVLEINNIQEVNKTDTNGLKQGVWKTKGWKDKIINISNYVNDTLNGYYFDWNGGQMDGYYLNGKKNGFFRHYYGDIKDESVLTIHLYEMDSLIWTGFPASDQMYLVNVKGFHSNLDSVFLEVPYTNGKIWYRGALVNNQEVGLHSVYSKNGQLLATVDYATEWITEFDSNEQEINSYGLKDYRFIKIDSLKN